MSAIFEELQKDDFEKARAVFREFDYQVVVRAAIEGTSPGKIWVDNVDAPQSGFIATTEGWFLGGDPHNGEFNEGLRNYIHRMILDGEYWSPVNPEFLAELFFHIDSDDWIENFPRIFDIRPPQPSHRIHFTCSKVNLEWRSLIPAGYRLVQVDSSFNPDEYEIPDDITEWMSSSLIEQKTRGFGKCLVHGNRIVVWINADCASGTDCEIGIITTKDYRKRGLGTATAAATVEDCLSSGFSMVGWHADTINQGSIATAEKVGFVKERNYVHYICMFDEATHHAEIAIRLFFDGKYEGANAQFNKAFELRDVALWYYVLAARSYGALGDSEKVKNLLMFAKSKGWSNWEPIRKCNELKDLLNPDEWDAIINPEG